jgi:hypothetical protein
MISDRGFRPLSFLIARVVDDRAARTNWPFLRMSRNVQLLCASAARADYRAWRFAIGVVRVGAERISESDPSLPLSLPKGQRPLRSVRQPLIRNASRTMFSQS